MSYYSIWDRMNIDKATCENGHNWIINEAGDPHFCPECGEEYIDLEEITEDEIKTEQAERYGFLGRVL